MTDRNKLYSTRFLKHIFWDSSSQVVSQLVHLAIRLILARLLAPSDFGLIAMAMVVISFTWWFLDIGFGSALVQRKDITDSHKSTAFWINVLLSIVVFIILALISPIVAHFFKARHLSSVLTALSFSLVLSSPESTLTALFQREFNFRAVAVRKAGAVLIGGVVGVSMAIAGFGVWALVGDALTRSLTGSMLLLVQSSWQPRLIIDRLVIPDLWGYSKHLLGARLLNYLNRNLDTILIGRFLGAQALGFYNIGYQFVLMPMTYLARSVNNVLFSTLSRIQDDPHNFRHGFLFVTKGVASLLFPLMALLGFNAKFLVVQFIGEKWEQSISLIPMMCIVGAIHSLYSLTPAVFQAKAENKKFARFVFINLIGNAIGFAIGLRWGIFGVALLYATVTMLLFPIQMNLILKMISLNKLDYIKALILPIFFSLLVGMPRYVIDGLGLLVDVNTSRSPAYVMMLSLFTYACLMLYVISNMKIRNLFKDPCKDESVPTA